jgi:hypothetical protein
MGLQTEVAKKIVKQDTNYTCFFHRKKRAKALQKKFVLYVCKN